MIRLRRACALLLSLLLLSAMPAGAEQPQALSLPAKLAKTPDKLYAAIDEHPGVTAIDLASATVDPEVLNVLSVRYPAITFTYQLSVFGKKASWDAQRVNLYPTKMTTEKQFRQLCANLRYLPNVTELTALQTTFTFDQLETLTSIRPGMHISCNLKIGKHSPRNTLTAFGTRHSYHSTRYTSDDMRALKYMDHLLALDVGHNGITDLSFLTDLPQLRVLILADNQITDLSPIAQLHSLEYLEIFKNPVTDLTPLAELRSLIDLNMTFCSVSDFSPLLALSKLERLWVSKNPISSEQLAALQQALPNCTINTTAGEIAPTAEGWRQKHPRYLQIVHMFTTGSYEAFRGI
ncbi:MAG: leucine-rich repeat domain-containing protein [Clostridia bacterium]